MFFRLLVRNARNLNATGYNDMDNSVLVTLLISLKNALFCMFMYKQDP